MLPAWLTAKAIQLCAAGVTAATPPAPTPYALTVHTGVVLTGVPANEADAEATVRGLLALGADFEAGPLAINGRDFARFGVTPATVFDACALARVSEGPPAAFASPTVSSVTALLRRLYAARITDTIRPINARYGAFHSWHKVGQAIDFVPAAGVSSITHGEIRRAMAQNGVRMLELLGPGDPGHSNHWHLAFARPGQVPARLGPIEGADYWFVNIASRGLGRPANGADATGAPALPPAPSAKAPPQWDVFAAADWRAAQEGGS